MEIFNEDSHHNIIQTSSASKNEENESNASICSGDDQDLFFESVNYQFPE